MSPFPDSTPVSTDAKPVAPHPAFSEEAIADWTNRFRAYAEQANGRVADYSAYAYFAGLGYGHLWLNVTDEAHRAAFEGDGGGAGGGVGIWWGKLITDDIERLYRDTLSYGVILGAAAMNVTLLDGNSKILGNFTGGGVSLAGMTGGGRGHWQKR